MKLHEVLLPSGCRTVRIARNSVVRTITLTCEPDVLGFVGFSRDSGYSSLIYLRRDGWQQVGFWGVPA